MKLEERPTPLTDAAVITIATSPYAVEVGRWKGDQVVKADFARRLEQLLGELAEALAGEDELNAGCECDHCKNTTVALSNWKKLQEGKETK